MAGERDVGARWEVEFHREFVAEFKTMDLEQRTALAAAARALEMAGPGAGRPLVGTLDNPRHPNMKELRYQAHGNQVWRVAFAFDPERRAIILVAGEKQGVDEKKFYRVLLQRANLRFDSHLKDLERLGRVGLSAGKSKSMPENVQSKRRSAK